MTIALKSFTKLYVVADLHLNDNDLVTTQKFLGFLRHLPHKKTALVLLGDLFEIWLAVNNNLSYQQRLVIDELNAYRHRGGFVALLAGNKDIAFKRKNVTTPVLHSNEDNFDVVDPDFLTAILEKNYKVVFHHGDCVDYKNYSSLAMRMILQWKITRYICSISPDKALAWMILINNKLLSKYKKNYYYFPEEQWRNWLSRTLHNFNAQLVVVGHFHPPQLLATSLGSNKVGLILPGWFVRQHYLYIDKTGYNLLQYCQ